MLQFNQTRRGDLCGYGPSVGQQRHLKDEGVGELTPGDASKADHLVQSTYVRSGFKYITTDMLS